ncbi:MAG TPA: penicillin acylase family protein [Terriglobales bacterium]|nr:penicillin acylase family protein [Terriglobales bacterium]
MSRIAILLLLASTVSLAQQPPAAAAKADARAAGRLMQQAKAALPETSGTLTVAGLRQPVTVLRDTWGVAHIYAANQHDLFFAQGYVAAQDRLFQMELWKRVGQGSLAEILGPGFVDRDAAARLVRFRGDMEKEYAAYGPDTKDILTAFTDGINAYIAERKASAKGLPLEFTLAGFEPEAWKPEDCLMRMSAYSLTYNAGGELYNAELVAAMGPGRAARLMDLHPKVQLDPVPGLDYAGLTPDLLKNFVGSDSRIQFPGGPRNGAAPEPDEAAEFSSPKPEASADDPSLFGSNDWTVAGRLTATGKPLLANDPHRTIAEPSLRYMVHLVAPAEGGNRAWDVIGSGEPALPGVAVGHNQNIAWGFTIFPIDQQDLYIEQLNPENHNQYKTPDGWKEIEVVRESFRVKGGEPVTRELRYTRHGAVIWSDDKRALVLHWVGEEPGTAPYLGSLAVDRAQNWKEFEAAMEKWKLPSENIVYADRAGNIGEHSAGLAPLRRNWTGLLPVDGASGKYEWSGFVAMRQLPHWFNPPAGFVATANNYVLPPQYPYKVGFDHWSSPYRVDRIRDLLQGQKAAGKNPPRKLTIKDMQAIQTDTVSLPARQLIALLRQAAPRSHDPLVQMLMKWDGNMRRDSPAAMLCEFWMNSLRRALTFRLLQTPDEPADDKLVALVEPRLPLPLVIAHLRNPSRAVFGDEPVAERNNLMITTLATARANITRFQKGEPDAWRWGRTHTASFRHPLDQTAAGAEAFDQGPVERPGDGNTVNATGGPVGPRPGTGAYTQTGGASYREIMDTADWDNSLAVNSPGQSGEPGSPHYGDLIDLWNEGKYFPLSYSRGLVEKNAKDKLVLQPK